MPAFDTLQVAKDLEVAFTPKQAEALVKAFAHSLVEDLVTKRDLSDAVQIVRRDIERMERRIDGLDSRIDGLETRIDGLETKIDTNTKMLEAKISTEVAAAKGEMIKWMVGAIAFNLLGTAGLMITLIKIIPH